MPGQPHHFQVKTNVSDSVVYQKWSCCIKCGTALIIIACFFISFKLFVSMFFVSNTVNSAKIDIVYYRKTARWQEKSMAGQSLKLPEKPNDS